MAKPRNLSVDLLLLSITLIWGINFSVLKLIYHHFHPLAFNALRFCVTSITFYLLLKLRRLSLRVDRKDLGAVISLAILSNTVYQFFFMLGLARTRAGNGGLLMAFTPIFAYLTGVFLKRERFHARVLGGILLSVSGVAVLILLGMHEVSFGSTWEGDLMILCAALCWGVYTGGTGRLIEKYGTLPLTALVMLIGTAFLVPLSLPWIIEQDWRTIPPRAWIAFCYATFLAIVYSYFAWNFAINRVGVARTAVYSNLTPVISLLAGWLLINEPPVLGQILGVILILAGLILVRRLHPVSDALPPEE